MKRILLLPLTSLLLPHGLHAAAPADLEKEYEQVRRIALRDPRVQSAYRDADRRLDAKIVQIDPALAGFVNAKQASREGTPPAKPALKAAKQPAPKPFVTAKPAPKPALAAPVARKAPTHTVASGETLGGIAAKHHVAVAALKGANHIQDERKLRVGQVLVIPSGNAAPQPKKEESAWSRLMH